MYEQRCLAVIAAETRFKDVRVNCFCASLLRTQLTSRCQATSCIERARCGRNVEIIAPVGTLVSVHGFNFLKCSVTPNFLLIDHFRCRLSMFCEILKKICGVEV